MPGVGDLLPYRRHTRTILGDPIGESLTDRGRAVAYVVLEASSWLRDDGVETLGRVFIEGKLGNLQLATASSGRLAACRSLAPDELRQAAGFLYAGLLDAAAMMEETGVQ